MNKIDISSNVSKFSIKNLLNSGAHTIIIDCGVSKHTILAGKLKNKMYIEMNVVLSLTTFLVDSRLPMKIDYDNGIISSFSIPGDFKYVNDGIYKNKYFNKNRKYNRNSLYYREMNYSLSQSFFSDF